MADDIKIYSFDIFDTVLTRIVGDPKDIFLLMQLELIEGKYDLPSNFINVFKKERIKAEQNSRKKGLNSEVNLENVYKEMSQSWNLTEKQTKMLTDLELNVEYRSIVPIAWTIREIARIRERGKRIIFVSDMYLPREYIVQLLDKVGVYKKGDALYVSNDLKCSKFLGSLFEQVLRIEKIKPHEMAHYGDKITSDMYVPVKMGIKLYQFLALGGDMFFAFYWVERVHRFFEKGIRRFYPKIKRESK